jgi:hypothetical protein
MLIYRQYENGTWGIRLCNGISEFINMKVHTILVSEAEKHICKFLNYK